MPKKYAIIFSVALAFRALMGLWCGGLPLTGEQYLKALEAAYHLERGEGYSEHWHALVYPVSHEDQLFERRLIRYGEMEGLHRDRGLENVAPRPLLSHPPGYSLLMWALLALGMGSVWPLYAVQVLIDSMVPLLLFPVMRSFVGDKAAWLGAWLYALLPPAAALSVTMSMDAPVPFLVAVLIRLHQRAADAGRWRDWAWLGAAAGAACYLRPNFLIYPAAVFALSFLMKKGLWKAALQAAATAGAIIITLLPWAAYNRARVGEWIFSSTGGGWTLCAGLALNTSNPWGLPTTDAKAREYLERVGLEWHSVEANRYFKDEFLHAAAEHPALCMTAALRRLPQCLFLRNFWGFYPEPSPRSLGSYTAEHGLLHGAKRYYQENAPAVRSRMLILSGWAVDACLLLLAYAGMALVFRERGPAMLVCLAPALILILSCLMTHVESRFIFPATAAYPFFAAAAAGRLWSLRQRRAGEPAPSGKA